MHCESRDGNWRQQFCFFVFKNCQIKESFCKVYKDPESFCFWVQTFCHRAFLKGSQHMDGNSLTWLLLGISESLKENLGSCCFLPTWDFLVYTLPGLWICCSRFVGRELENSSSQLQDLTQGLLRRSTRGMNEMTSGFWRASTFMKQVQRAEMTCLRSHSSLAAELALEPRI